jgi:cbb3-type cytochrome oxidase subunit 3
MTVETIIELGSSIGLLGLFGTFGTAIWRYRRRQKDQREAVKRAIFTELLTTDHLDRAYSLALDDEAKDHHVDIEANLNSGTPVNQFLSTKIGLSYSDDYGLLEDEEIDAVTAYYSEAENLREVIRTRRTFEMSMKEGHDELCTELGGIVAGEIQAVKERRDRLLRLWCSDFNYTLEELKQQNIHVDPGPSTPEA